MPVVFSIDLLIEERREDLEAGGPALLGVILCGHDTALLDSTGGDER